MVELNGYIEQLKTISQKEIESKDRNFLRFKKYINYLNNGKIVTRDKLIKGNGDGSAVVMLPVTNNNNVILVVEPRVFTDLTVGVGLPAGYIEPNENPLQAVKRELLEETGYEGNEIIPLINFYQDEGCSSAYNRSYLVKNCQKIGVQHLDKDEYIKYFECHYDEALELVDLGYIQGVNSILTLEKSKAYIMERR